MRQPDSTDRIDSGKPEEVRKPEVSLWEFEADLKRTLDRAKERETPPNEEQLKKLVRLHCKQNGSKLGLTEQEIPYATMYFFRLLYEDPANASKQWELLYEIARNVNDPEKAEDAFDKLLSINTSGLTLMWRLVRGIVNGDYDVHEVKNGDTSFYYICRPQDAAKRNDDEIRKALSAGLKAKIGSEIISKPEPENKTDIKDLTVFDTELFNKIVRQLQNDSDILVENPQWHGYITQYLTNRVKDLGETQKSLKVQEGRHETRKQKYERFFQHLLRTYIKPLLLYCKKMVETPEERNPFAAGIMLETHFVTNSLFSNNSVTEPQTDIIFDHTWARIRKEIKMFAEESATMMGMPVYRPSEEEAESLKHIISPPAVAATVQQAAEDVITVNQPTAEPSDFSDTPSAIPEGSAPLADPTTPARSARSKRHTHTLAFHPHTTGELPPTLVSEVNRLADMQAAKKRGIAQGGASPNTEPAVIIDPLMHLAGPLPPTTSGFNPPGTPIYIGTKRTDEIIAETLAPYIKETQDVNGAQNAHEAQEKYVVRPDGITTGEIHAAGMAETMQYIPAMVSPNTPEEQALATEIKRAVEIAFRKNIKVINTSKGSAPLIRDLESIYKKSCQTRHLDKVFIGCLVEEYSNVLPTLDNQTNALAILYEVLRGFINKIEGSSTVPAFLETELRGKDEIPPFELIQQLLDNMPRISNFTKLLTYYAKKGKTGEVKRREHVVDTVIFQSLIIRLLCLKQAQSAFNQANGDPEKNFEDTTNKIRKMVFAQSDKNLLQGHWSTRWFRNTIRSKQLKKQMRDYQAKVDQTIETAWHDILVPILARFGKIMLTENK